MLRVELFEKCLTKSHSCSSRIQSPLLHVRMVVVGCFLTWQVFMPLSGLLTAGFPGILEQLCALACALRSVELCH